MDNAPNSLEPVAWMYAAEGKLPLITGFRVNPADYGCAGRPETPLYAHPAPKPADSQLVEVDYERLALLTHNAGMQDWPKPWDQRPAAEALKAALSQHQSPADAERDRIVAAMTAYFGELDACEDYRSRRTNVPPIRRLFALKEAEANARKILTALASGAHREAGE